MILYLLRTIFCAALFMLAYRFIFQHERMYKFNRVYLLVAPLVALFIPLLQLEDQPAVYQQLEQLIPATTTNYLTTISQPLKAPPEQFVDWQVWGWAFYGFISVLFLVRLLRSTWQLRQWIQSKDVIAFKQAKIALTKKQAAPFSFLNYIFLPKTAYQNGEINSAIIDHELAHVTQKHSYDVLWIEFLIACCWFNPIFYFFRNAIRLNHEFLADEAVIHKHQNIPQYQQLVLNQVAEVNQLHHISSSFNFIQTKKRLTMMSKRKSHWKAFTKQLILVPLVATALFLFTENTVAQQVKESVTEVIEAKEDGSTEAEKLQEKFDLILSKYQFKKTAKGHFHTPNISEEDRSKLGGLYTKMSKAQQDKQRLLMLELTPRKKHTPTAAEFEAWKNPKAYGIWLDGKRISNEQLNNYQPSDFSHFSESRLHKNAKNYGKHTFQLDLWSNTKFDAENQKLAGKNVWMALWVRD